MDNLSLKEKLHQCIDEGDETLITMMWDAVTAYSLENVSATIEDYNKDIDESLEQYKKGEFITQKELEEQSEKW